MEPTPKDKRSVAELFQQVWSQALAGVTGVEEEASRLLHRVQGVAGWSQEGMKKQVREFSEKLAAQRREAEKRLDDTVRQSLSKLRVPRREEIEKLNARLEGLSKRVEALSR